SGPNRPRPPGPHRSRPPGPPNPLGIRRLRQPDGTGGARRSFSGGDFDRRDASAARAFGG
ncbi:hypothetical protein, partial [Streptomyces griseorubiginosus]|uniref:hypothetical protein n=1 Tax=Streptomyces griseorubiginosus TaxID=67304 RepID=UPI001AD6279C